jgi:hypothetical protein
MMSQPSSSPHCFVCEEEDRIVGLLIADASDDDDDLDEDDHHDNDDHESDDEYINSCY